MKECLKSISACEIENTFKSSFVFYCISLLSLPSVAYGCIPKYQDCNPGRKVEGFEAFLIASAVALLLFTFGRAFIEIWLEAKGWHRWLLPIVLSGFFGFWLLFDWMGAPSYAVNAFMFFYFFLFLWTLYVVDACNRL